jgi:hypothetical protein
VLSLHEGPNLGGDVMGQGDALYSEGYQTGRKECDQGSRMREAR